MLQNFGFSLCMRMISPFYIDYLVTWISKSRFNSMNMYKWSQPESSQGFWSYQPTWRREASGLRFVDLSECRSLTAPTVAGTALRCLHNVAVGEVWRLHLRIVWGTCQWRSWSFTNAEGGTSRAGDCMVDALSTAHRTGVDEWWAKCSWNLYEIYDGNSVFSCIMSTCQRLSPLCRVLSFCIFNQLVLLSNLGHCPPWRQPNLPNSWGLKLARLWQRWIWHESSDF